MTTTYETGASSHAVNDLILFTENTRELAELRDEMFAKLGKKLAKSSAAIGHTYFHPLLRAATRKYAKEFPNRDDNKHIVAWYVFEYDEKGVKRYNTYDGLSGEQCNEYCRLYALDFELWKQENIATN